MASLTPLITGTDFITVATRDFDAAASFYGGVLGLPESKRWGPMPAAEFETGNLTIAVMQWHASTSGNGRTPCSPGPSGRCPPCA